MEEQRIARTYPNNPSYHNHSHQYTRQREYPCHTHHDSLYPPQRNGRSDSDSRQYLTEAGRWHTRQYGQPSRCANSLTVSNTYRSHSPPIPSLPIRQRSEHPLARHSDEFEYPPNHVYNSRPAPPVPLYPDPWYCNAPSPPPYDYRYLPHHSQHHYPHHYPRYPYPAPDRCCRSPEYPAPYQPPLPPVPPQCNCGDVACLEYTRSSPYPHEPRYGYCAHPPPPPPPPEAAYPVKEPVEHPYLEGTSPNHDTKISHKSGNSIIVVPKVSPTGGINVLAVEVAESPRGRKKPSIPPELVAKSDLPPANITEQKRYVCQHCNKAFSRPSSLTTHTYTHTGERPFGCTIPGCGRSFSVLSNLRRHLRICQRRRGGLSAADNGSSLDDNASTQGSETGSTSSGGPIRYHSSHTTKTTKRSRTTLVSIERTTDDGGSKKVVSVSSRTEKIGEEREDDEDSGGSGSENDEMEDDEKVGINGETVGYDVQRQLKKTGSLAELAEVAAAVAAASISPVSATGEEGERIDVS